PRTKPFSTRSQGVRAHSIMVNQRIEVVFELARGSTCVCTARTTSFHQHNYHTTSAPPKWSEVASLARHALSPESRGARRLHVNNSRSTNSPSCGTTSVGERLVSLHHLMSKASFIRG